jgi:hypothetical protein
VSVNNGLAICGISSKDELRDDHMGCGRTQEEQADTSLKHSRVLPKLVLFTKPLIHSFTFFYQSNGGYFEHGIDAVMSEM